MPEQRYLDSKSFAFRSGCYAALEDSRDPRLRLVSRKQRHAIVEAIMREWEVLANHTGTGTSEHFRKEMSEGVRASLSRKRWGYPWLPVVLMVAEVILKILIEKWFTDDRSL